MRGRARARAFAAAADSRNRGRVAEEAAATWLREQGYRIQTRNYATRWAEVDVVARDGAILCFIEVKARASAAAGSPLDAVTAQKQRRLARAAAHYLMDSGWEGACRFDVLGIEIREGEPWRYELVRNAFDLAPDA